jgi:predicted DNA-binding transcriptional regulator AlpA
MQSLMTKADLAAFLQVAPRTVDQLRQRPDFPRPLRLGYKTVRWRREDVERWAEQARKK